MVCIGFVDRAAANIVKLFDFGFIQCESSCRRPMSIGEMGGTRYCYRASNILPTLAADTVPTL